MPKPTQVLTSSMADQPNRDAIDPDRRDTETVQSSSSEGADSDWLPADAGLDEPLPEDVQTALGRLFGGEVIETMGEWAAEIRDATGGDAIRVEDLCHASEPTGHYGETVDETYHFQCFYDAVVLAALVDEPVDVHTESPRGETVEASVDQDGSVTTTPPDAVVSFGVSEHVEPPADGQVSHADVYAAVCPYVRAFPDRAAYREWATDVSAATIATPVASATSFTTALVGDH